MNLILQDGIDYELLGKAVRYYRELHFEAIEVPYVVPVAYNNLTKPAASHGDKTFMLDHDVFSSNPVELLGSAEQGFLYLADHNLLKQHQQYFSVTPCFRYEETYTRTHRPWFIKLELYVQSEHANDVMSFVNMAKTFMQQHTHHTLRIVETDNDCFDLYVDDIEVGSYGRRTIHNRTYVYGTGLALPRFSLVQR